MAEMSSIASILNAYNSGKMSPIDAKEFEDDVNAGKIMLPRGGKLKPVETIKTTVQETVKATAQEPILLPQAITNAYVSNQMSEKDRKDLDADIRAGLVRLPPTVGGTIPTDIGVPLKTEQGIIERPPEPSLVQKIIGAGEAGLSLATGATTGALGLLGGIVEGAIKTPPPSDAVTQDAARRAIEQTAVERAQGLTYAPRTATGQEYTQQAGEFLARNLPPIAPVTAPGAVVQAVGQVVAPAKIAAKAGAVTTGQAAKKVSEAVTAPIVSAKESIKSMITGEEKPTTVSGASVGAAATPEALRRVTTAEGLPVPITLTRGGATRDAAQLAFEKEQMKSASFGQPLRDRAEENNLQALQNFDRLIDLSEAQSPNLTATGSSVTKALSEGYKQAKNQTRVAFTDAKKSPEANNVADTRTVVTLKYGDDEIVGSLTDYLNSKITGVPSSSVTDAVKKIMIKQGIAIEDSNGNLIGVPSTVAKLEDLRRETSGLAKFDDKTGIRDETIVKKIIDLTTEPVSGPLFKKARSLRETQARKFENRAVVARLIRNRAGMDDPQVAVDQVFKRTILDGSPEEITFIKRILNTSGEDGQQAWKELQGATINDIKNEATKGMGMGANDSPIVSPAQLHKAITVLDKNGRLDIVFGKQVAATIRDIDDVVRYVNTVPPGTLINASGTAGTLLAALGEVGLSGSLIGLPVPVLTGIKFIKKLRNEKATKKQIADALNALPPMPPKP